MKKLFILCALLSSAIAGYSQADTQKKEANKRRADWMSRPMKNPGVHDPVIALGEDGRYYIFSTGMNVGVMSSADLEEWRFEAPALPETPAWAIDTVPGYRGSNLAVTVKWFSSI